MAAFAPAIPYLLAGATVAAGTASAISARNAGISRNIELKEQAKQEQLAAKDREIERRRSLIETIATQNAEAGAAGDEIQTGSRRAIALEDIRRQRLDDLTDRAMTNRRAVTLRASGRAAQRSGNLQAAGTLLDTAGSFRKAS
jgi:hypothetical protein